MSSPATAQLILIKGDSENFQQVIDLHSVNMTIGRAASCDIMWGSLQISRKHATLEYMIPKWYIRDLSTNGLNVNGTKVGKGELFVLSDSDIISFIPTGSVQYRFRYTNNTPPRIPRFTSTPRTTSTGFGATAQHAGGVLVSPQPSTSRSAMVSAIGSVLSRSRPGQVEARGRPSIEIIRSEYDNGNDHSDSEDSNHSESLLSLDDPPDPEFLSFSDQDHADAPSPAVSDESSSGPFPSKRKHGESDSDCSNSTDKRKKRLLFHESSADDSNESSSNTKSDPVPSTSSCSRFKNLRVPNLTGFMTEDQISNCTDVKTLKLQLKQCLTKLASTEVKLKTVECERVMEKEEHCRETDIESLTAAIKEENYKKILELLESELSCAVCNEIFIQATVIDCGHTFCSFCINEWYKKKQECPICRKAIRIRSRHIEVENFVTKTFESFNEEISSKRKTSIKEREEQIKKAAEVRPLADLGRPGAPGDSNANFHSFMQRTAETYVDFLAELHQFNELLGPPRPSGRGNSANAAERRRSARIQDRVIDAVATGAAGPSTSRPTQSARRGRHGGSRTTPREAAATRPTNPAVAEPVGRNIPIPVVTLEDSGNGGNGNVESPAQPLGFPNQLLNYPVQHGPRSRIRFPH